MLMVRYGVIYVHGNGYNINRSRYVSGLSNNECVCLNDIEIGNVTICIINTIDVIRVNV